MPGDHVTVDYLSRLRARLSRVEERIAADVRPAPGGAAIVAATSVVVAGDEVGVLLAAYRAVATTGARPERVSVCGSADVVPDLLDRLRLHVDDCSGEASSITITGLVDDVDRCTPMALGSDGDLVYWLGRSDQSDSERVELERKVGEVMVAASRDGLLNAALDVGPGGMATTLALMAVLGGTGARFWTPEGVDVERALFDARLGGVICIVPRTEELRFSDMCIARYLPVERIGVVDGSDLECQGHFRIPVAELT